MENPQPYTRKYSIPVEAVVSALIALVVSTGAFYSLQTALAYDERTIQRLDERVTTIARRLEDRIEAIENRERSKSDVVVRINAKFEQVQEDLKTLKGQMNTVLSRLPAKR